MEIQPEQLRILKDIAVKHCTQYVSKSAETGGILELQKVSVFPIPKEQLSNKECSNYCTIVLISHASQFFAQNPSAKLPVLCLRQEHQLDKLVLKKAEEPGIQSAIITGSTMEKVREFQKKILTSLLVLIA